MHEAMLLSGNRTSTQFTEKTHGHDYTQNLQKPSRHKTCKELPSRTHQLPEVLHGIFQYPSSCFWLLQFIVNAEKAGRKRPFNTVDNS